MVGGMKLLAAPGLDPLIGLRETEAAKKKAEEETPFALEALQSATTIVSAAMLHADVAERCTAN